jgi:nitroimidazol reductase NimA-like FMN-containing flavoprotein (pyridoxamine 5'-phosphate oxidase superfamily)
MEQQGDLNLLQDPLALALLESRQLARLAYTWTDGTPRVVPMWFHWNGSTISHGSPVKAPKLGALEQHPDVAVTIDDSTAWPYKALLVRGRATVQFLDDVSPEYVASAHRYFGDEQGEEWLKQLRGVPMARVVVEPRWVGLLDFVTRFPSALSA